VIEEIPAISDWEGAWSELEKLNISLNGDQQNKLQLFYELLKECNQNINLTRLISLEDFLTFHLIDTAMIYRLRQQAKSYLDIGSGGGIPGIILCILWNYPETVLSESVKKKADFLKKAAMKLNLKDKLTIQNHRAESLKGTFSEVTARAVAKPLKALEIASPLVCKKQGHFMAQTTHSLSHDQIYQEKLSTLKGKIEAEINFMLAGKARCITMIRYY